MVQSIVCVDECVFMTTTITELNSVEEHFQRKVETIACLENCYGISRVREVYLSVILSTSSCNAQVGQGTQVGAAPASAR